MRVVFLSVSAELGGSETALVQLVDGLTRVGRGLDLHACVPREGPLAERLAARGVRIHVLAMPAALATFGETGAQGTAGRAGRAAAFVAALGAAGRFRRELRARLASLRPDVVHSNGLKTHVLAAGALPARAALVWHVHEYVGSRAFTRRLMRHYLPRAAAIAANSDSVARDVRTALGDRAPVFTVPNGVDLEAFSPAGDVADLDALSGLPDAGTDTIRVGLPATFGRWKGHAVFLGAVRQVAATLPIRAYIIGGPLYDTSGSQYSLEEMRALAQAEAPGVIVGLTGFVSPLAPALRALDIVVHASTQPEPFGLVIAEAMACGRAVVVSGAGGAAEIVRAGTDALTHPPGHAAALADTIERLARDGGLRRALGDAARAAALARFDGDAYARRMLAVYERVSPATEAVAS